MANKRGKVEAMTDFILLNPKITVEVTAAMKLKDACTLEGKLCLISLGKLVMELLVKRNNRREISLSLL